MRLAGVVAVSALLLIGGCGAGSGDDDAAPTIALLRAVPAERPGPFLDELRAAGFVGGTTLEIVPERFDETHADPADAKRAVKEWVANGAELVIAYSSSGARAAREVAPDTNILFLVNDPTAVGLIENEEHPEGRLTGVTFRVPADRTLALARQAIPDLDRLGFLVPADDPAGPPHEKAVSAAAGETGIALISESFEDEEGIVPAVDALAAADVDAVLVANTPTSVLALGTIGPILDERKIPLIANVDLAQSALLVLTPDVDEVQAQLGRQAARLLSGAQPRDVPVEDPRRFRILVNTAQAAALGLPPLPDSLLRQADEVRP